MKTLSNYFSLIASNLGKVHQISRAVMMILRRLLDLACQTWTLFDINMNIWRKRWFLFLRKIRFGRERGDKKIFKKVVYVHIKKKLTELSHKHCSVWNEVNFYFEEFSLVATSWHCQSEQTCYLSWWQKMWADTDGILLLFNRLWTS